MTRGFSAFFFECQPTVSNLAALSTSQLTKEQFKEKSETVNFNQYQIFKLFDRRISSIKAEDS